MKKYILSAATITLMIIFGIFPPPVLSSNKIPVFVSILPQKFFVQQIGGSHVDVQVMVQPGASPAIYEPKPSQMAKLSSARIYFSIGVPFEKIWLKRVSAANPAMKIIYTDQGIRKRAMASHHQDHGDHHAAADDTHENEESPGLDPHIWLSPRLVKIQAGIILKSLTAAAPSGKQEFEKNHRNFIQKIEALDLKIQSVLNDTGKKAFMVFHPSWGYFADDYHLEQRAIEIEGKNPKPAQVKQLIHMAQKENIRIIFAQPQFSTKSAELIARQIKGRVVFADPLAENWLANMEMIAQKFKEALK